jgi:hypothetical protein
MFIVTQYTREQYEKSRKKFLAMYGRYIASWDVYKAGLDSRGKYGSRGWKKHRPKGGDVTVLVMCQNQNGEVVYRIMRGDFTITDGGINFYSTLDFTVVPVIGGSKPTISIRRKIVLPVDCCIYEVRMCYPCINLALLYKPVGPPHYPISLAYLDDDAEDAPAPASCPFGRDV